MNTSSPFEAKGISSCALFFVLCYASFLVDVSAQTLPFGGSATNSVFGNDLLFENKEPQLTFNTAATNGTAVPQYLSAEEEDELIDFRQTTNKEINLHNILTDLPADGEESEEEDDFFGTPIAGLPGKGATEAESPSLPEWLGTHGIANSTDLNRDLNGDGVSLLDAYSQNMDPNMDLSSQILNATNDSSTVSDAEAGNGEYEVNTSTNLLNWPTL